MTKNYTVNLHIERMGDTVISLFFLALMAFQEGNPDDMQMQEAYRFEESKEPEKAIDPELMPVQNLRVGIHKYYLTQLSMYGDPVIVFTAKPTNVYRRYFFKIVVDPGTPPEADLEVTENDFYDHVFKWLRYGTPDSVADTYFVNQGFISMVNDLYKYKLLTPEMRTTLGSYYIRMKWIESAYYLDNAASNSVTVEQWQAAANDNALSTYFRTLARIKLAGFDMDKLEAVRKILDTELAYDFQNNVPKAYFQDFAKAYGVLLQKGVSMPEELQFHLLGAYLNENAANQMFEVLYPRYGLPIPDKNVLYRTLVLRVKLALDRPVMRYAREFRRYGLDFPKEYAGLYRDAALSDFGTCDLEDVHYLIKIAGEDAKPQLWKKFGDSALEWHASPETRVRDLDTGDYYHQAVEAYRRASLSMALAFSEHQKAILASGRADPTVRIRDVITALELMGVSAKEEAILSNLDARVAGENPFDAGAYLDQALGVVIWRANKFGQKPIPFDDEITLASYINDPVRTRRLSVKIAEYALTSLIVDGNAISNLFTEGVFAPQNLADDLEKQLRSCDTPTFKNLDAVIDLYAACGFNDGLVSLANYLRDNGFVLPARRAFRLAGRKEAEEQVYSKYDDAYWQKQQEDFNYQIRK